VVLYGCESWSLVLREKHRLRVFEKRALRRIFGPKRDEVTGGWRKLHNEELHNFYSSPNIIRIIWQLLSIGWLLNCDWPAPELMWVGPTVLLFPCT
jgi:hypothetical protein